MKYAYFPGCKIPHHLPEYGSSMEAVCAVLDIELVKPEFNCCGYPVRHENELASIFPPYGISPLPKRPVLRS